MGSPAIWGMSQGAPPADSVPTRGGTPGSWLQREETFGAAQSGKRGRLHATGSLPASAGSEGRLQSHPALLA